MSRSHVALVALATLIAVPAAAKVVTVNPGPGTPLQDAIDSALPRDTIKLTPGIYGEAVVVDKPLRLIGPRRGVLVPAVIDAGCAATAALTIGADDVRVQRISVTRGSFYTVDVEDRDGVLL